MRFTGSLLLVIAAAAIGCGGSDANSEQTSPAADAGADTSPEVGLDAVAEPDALADATEDAPPDELAVEAWGGRIFGPVMGLARAGRTLWIGTNGLPDPYGLSKRVRAGLGRLDIDTGEFRLFDTELPELDYGEGLKGAVPTAGVAQDDDRTLIVAFNGLVIGSQDKFTLQTLDNGASPSAVAVDREGGRSRVWVATDKGLMRLNADTLALEQLHAGAELGGFTQTRYLALDRTTGAVYVSVHSDTGSSLVARVEDDSISTITPGEGALPGGNVGEIVFDDKRGRAYIALAQWSAGGGGVLSWDGTSAEPLVLEGPLGESVSGQPAAFGAAHLAISVEDDILVVGGTLKSSFNGLSGGGLAWVNLETRQVAGVGWGDEPMPGDHVSALAYDPVTHRTYASVYHPCSEVKLGNAGLVSIAFDSSGGLHVERPVLSTVRAMAVSGDRVFAGVRDDNPGLGCDGYTIQTGFVELHANRSGEMIPLNTAHGDNEITSYAGPVAIDMLQADRVALGTLRDGTLLGDPRSGYGFNQAIDYSVSLYTSDVSWLGNDKVWLAGPATHMPGDPPQTFDNGPRGATLLEVAGDGAILGATHYVRKASDPKDKEGLPSSHVWAAVPASDGSSYLVCGVEQQDISSLDRQDFPPFTGDGSVPERWGGIVRVLADGSLETITTSEQTPDPRALAIEKSGALIVLDKLKGMLRVEKGDVQPVQLPVPLADALVPHAIWAGDQGDLAALYDTGVVLSLAGINKGFPRVGHAWSALQRAPGVLLIGTDEGLLRVRAPGAVDAAFSPALPGSLPTWEVEGDPNAQPDAGVDAGPEGGSCIPLNGVCNSNPDGCCAGLVCGGSGFALMCVNP